MAFLCLVIPVKEYNFVCDPNDKTLSITLNFQAPRKVLFDAEGKVFCCERGGAKSYCNKCVQHLICKLRSYTIGKE